MHKHNFIYDTMTERNFMADTIKPEKVKTEKPRVEKTRAAKPKNEKAKTDKLRIIPLGGLNEIGKNMTVIEYGNDIIVVAVSYTHLDVYKRQ